MINYKYLRSKKAEHLSRRENTGIPIIEVDFSVIDNSIILPRKLIDNDTVVFGRGGVLDSNGNYIENSGLPNKFGGFYPFDKVEHRDEQVVYCGMFVNHWGHFLVEAVARLWYFLDYDDGVSKYVFVIEENTDLKAPNGNFLRFFELFGIADRVEFINKPTCFKTVVIPKLAYSRMGHFGEQYRYYDVKYKEIFEAVAKNAIAINPAIDKSDKIYFSRGHFLKAIDLEVGHDFLEQYFEANGFKILYPEELTLEEMICYIRNAEICAMPSGTLPHNSLFAQDGQKVVIVERMMPINEFQVDIDLIKNLDATYVDGYWLVYPGFSGVGPFLYGYTQEFRSFTNDFNYSHPNEYYLSEEYKKKCLSSFIKIHKNFCAYDWGMEKWTTIYADAIYESHEATVQEFSDYIKGIKPFMFKHYFQPPYIKRMIKRLILKKRG